MPAPFEGAAPAAFRFCRGRAGRQLHTEAERAVEQPAKLSLGITSVPTRKLDPAAAGQCEANVITCRMPVQGLAGACTPGSFSDCPCILPYVRQSVQRTISAPRSGK